MSTTPASFHEPAASPHPRVALAPARATRAEVLALAARAGRVAEGFALLEHAALECVAVMLCVGPPAVERVRAALEDPTLREEAIRRCGEAATARRPAPEPAAPPAPSSPDLLLAAARLRPDGLPLLLNSAPEVAAIAFGVHPALVHRAREAAARAGVTDLSL